MSLVMQHLKNIDFKKSEGGNSFIENLSKETSKGETANGAVTYTRSGSALLDFYAQAGAMRKNKEQALELFIKAFSEDNEKAVRILFYLRDVRGGQGERDLFRVCLEWLGTNNQEVFEKIVGHVSEYGRWDDLFFDNAKCFELIVNQLRADSLTDKPTLLAKWLPTVNASSSKTRAKARFMAGKLGIGEKHYRTSIRDIRKKIGIVESQMSARKWDEINYSSVPSQASRIYKDAFGKHDEVRYNEFISKAQKGEVKINSGTLYPYQIYKSAKEKYSNTLDALWNQLPDYTKGKNALVVADVSGSMDGDPISVSVSLALYFAERNKGQFKDHFITFSANPVLQKITGKNLKEKMDSIETSQWDMNTDIQKVFDRILEVATKNNTPVSELPETIYIISDMEFDNCCRNRTNLEVIREKYENSGYKLPNIVFWNVNASGKNLPARKNEVGVSLVSGFSPVIFSIAVENKTAEQVMLDTINGERYSKICL